MNRTPNTFYIGRIKCDTNNAMMREIAELMKRYEYSLLYAQPSDWLRQLKANVGVICDKYKRCANIELQRTEQTPDGGYSIYAYKPDSDHSILCITVHAVLNEIVLKSKEE